MLGQLTFRGGSLVLERVHFEKSGIVAKGEANDEAEREYGRYLLLVVARACLHVLYGLGRGLPPVLGYERVQIGDKRAEQVACEVEEFTGEHRRRPHRIIEHLLNVFGETAQEENIEVGKAEDRQAKGECVHVFALRLLFGLVLFDHGQTGDDVAQYAEYENEGVCVRGHHVFRLVSLRLLGGELV